MSGTGFSLSFKGAKKPLPKVSVQVKEKEQKVDFVTGISGSSISSLEPKQTEGPKIIPKIENTFQVGVGKTTTKAQRARDARFRPEEGLDANKSNEDRFELAEDTAIAQASHIKYGLTKMAAPDKEKQQGAGGGDSSEQPSALSQLISRADAETQQMKEDLEKLPEAASLEAYEAMPIEAFGAAMLRGMGWKEGMNVGRNQKAEIKAVEYVPRPGRLGLGAQPAAPGTGKDKKYIKPGETRGAKPDLVLARDADGRQRNVRGLDEKLVQREVKGPHPGKVMWIASGHHSGFFCSVLAVEHTSGSVEVRLKPSDETVTVAAGDLVERWERDAVGRKGGGDGGRDESRDSRRERDRERDHRDKKKSKDKDRRRDREHDRDRDRNHDRDRDRDRDRDSSRQSKRSRRSPDEAPERRRAPPWLAADIRVRIVDKRLGRGKLYLKKGTVTDVHGPRTCDVQVDGTGETVQGVEQEQLETLVPKGEGIRVLILAGEHRWHKARLLQRNADTGMAAVQLTGDFAVLKLPLDDISEYVGPMQEDE